MEQIQFHIETNPISHWNQSNFTSEQIKFHMWKNFFFHTDIGETRLNQPRGWLSENVDNTTYLVVIE